MKLRALIPLFLASSLCLFSCSFLHDDSVVARVGKKKLYRSQVVKVIPPHLPQQDSLALARKYINAWAGELIMSDMASQQLSKQERDVAAEIEEYRNSLLKYRYEQHYIQERLDTAVSQEEIQAFYEESPSAFALSSPIVKARFVRISSSSPRKAELVRLLRSDKEEDAAMLDSLGRSVCERYTDYGGKWTDIAVLSRSFRMDYGTLLSLMKDSIIDVQDSLTGMENIAFVSEMLGASRIPPVEYCAPRVRESIISKRKYALSSTLEQELLEDALRKGTFVITQTDE